MELTVDGRTVTVDDDGGSLLDVLRERLGIRSVKDGCSPQGQCGCCTVLVDGSPRVACVTPARRVAGRTVTTVDGLDDAERWATAFATTGASQCGFCTPGIIVRLSALAASGAGVHDAAKVERALLAHLCRCTGWRTILDAWQAYPGTTAAPVESAVSIRATIEGRAEQRIGPAIALGRGGFADDTAPDGALVAVPAAGGGWAVAASLAAARWEAGKVQGRRTTVAPRPPLAVPEGEWVATLRTSWMEPAYLELDASWCRPGETPAPPLANGGAFGGKVHAGAAADAQRLAAEHGRPVRVVYSREDAVRRGAKRPPVAAGIRSDGTGVLRAARTPGLADVVQQYAPAFVVEEVDVAGPPTSMALRAAGWAEVALLQAAQRGDAEVRSPDGAVARATIAGGVVQVHVRCGEVLEEVVLRSYCTGAAHMALGWVTSEGLAVDDDGEVHDLTIRSFGVLRAVDTPPVEVTVEPGDGPAVNGSDAVFVAVAAACWLAQGCPPELPTGVSVRA